MTNTQSDDTRIPCSARFRAVGDLMVHQKQLDVAKQPDGSYHFYPQFAGVRDLLKNADYTIANLETTIGMVGGLPYSGYPRFNTPASFLDAVRDAGVDFLTLANNHIMDRDYEGIQTTANNVAARGFDFGGVAHDPSEMMKFDFGGVAPDPSEMMKFAFGGVAPDPSEMMKFAFGGVAPDPSEMMKEKPVVIKAGGIRVGFLCYTATMNKDSSCASEAQALKKAKRYGVYTLQDADYAADVRSVREAGAEVVFALVHWGLEYRRKPEDDTVLYARKLIAAGVDVILGSHPHMVQPVEFLDVKTEDGSTRRGLVAYSLGNFISNQADRYTDSGIILDFTVCRLYKNDIIIKNVGIIPTYCWRREDVIMPLCSQMYLHEPPEGMDDETWFRLKESYEEMKDLFSDTFPFFSPE